MTIEERFEFLFQSIASHDQQLGELAEKVAALTENQAETGRQMKAIFARMDARDAAVQVKFETLAQAMLGLTEHAANHARRIERLEG